MSLCRTIRDLAAALEASRTSLVPHDRLLLAILKDMPLYADAKRLDAWERSFKAIRSEAPNTPSTALIDGVFDLGEHNLYTAFDPRKTQELYAALAGVLSREGIACPQQPELSSW